MSVRSRSALPLARLLFVASAAASFATAQADAQRRTVWDGAYTEAQATRGTAAYGQSCSGCHALTVEGKAPLVGDAFWKSFAQRNVGDLLEFVSANMPNGRPRSLSESTYEDIVAYILKSNGFPAGTSDLGANTSGGLKIIQKDGSTALPADALAQVVGCLAKSGSDWVLMSATTPERADTAAGENATRPLGSHTMTLKYVVTRIDQWAGSRVVVNALLIGADGSDGLNVMSVSPVAPKCP
jgi:mono/diheme cytochrome c family protein